MTAKFNADLLGRLADATAEELTQARADLRADAAAYEGQDPTPASVAAYNELLGYARQIAAELDSRRQAASAAPAQFAEMDQLTADPPDDASVTDASADSAADDASALADTSADAGGDDTGGTDDNNADDGAGAGDTGDDDTANEGEAVTASARRRIGSVNRQPAQAVTTLDKVTLTTTARGGVSDFEPGATLTRQQAAEAFSNKARAVQGPGGGGYERHAVFTVRSTYPEGRMLRRNVTGWANIERVEAVVDAARSRNALLNLQEEVQVQSASDGTGALTAAGLCAPLETLYDIRTVGDTDRPVRDSLVRFGADRGGIQYRPALEGVSQTGGIGVWTAANDAADPLVPKTCVEIDCPGILDAEVDAIYQCLTFSNMSTRFDPEWMESTIRAQAVAHARFAENRILAQLVAGSKTVYSARTLGASRDILYTLDRMVAYYRNVHRYNREVPFRWIAPAWALNLMRADITRQMVGDGLQSLAVTDAELLRWLAVRNINATFHLDGIDPADITLPDPDVPVPAQFYTLLVANSPVPDFPTALSTLLFAEGDWLWLDGGTLDFGVVRDSTLNAQNRFQTFSESFETVAFRGIESLHLVIPALPTGESAATADTTP